MGTLLSRDIVQSRIWVDPAITELPNLNYKYTYPITVFDAVQVSMEDGSTTLRETIDNIYGELKGKQPIFPARPADYLMTFAGVPGAVGSIKISNNIPWDPTQQKHTRIPTEKAVGDLLSKLGLIDEDGHIDPSGGQRVRWSDIINRPAVYHELGYNEDGVVIQKAITDAIDLIKSQVNMIAEESGTGIQLLSDKLNTHINRVDNPHNITLDQLNAVSMDSFEFHTQNFNNPHVVTQEQIGLGNIDNTSDMSKPISIATQEALDHVNAIINALNSELNDLSYIIDGTYDQSSGNLTLILRNGSTIVLHIPINGLVYTVSYDIISKNLLLTHLSGDVTRISLEDLFIRYIGSVETQITITIDGNQISGNQTIKAMINPLSITDVEMADNSIMTRMIMDQSIITDKMKDLSVTTIKLSDSSVTTEKLEDLSITTNKLVDRSVIASKLFTSVMGNRVLAVSTSGSDPDWSLVTNPMIDKDAIHTDNIIDDSITTEKIRDNTISTSKLKESSITTDRIHNLSVTNEKIDYQSIDGSKLYPDIEIPGTPTITHSPDDISNGNQIPDTQWVQSRLKEIEVENHNLSDRIVDGRVLFTSDTSNRVLGVLNRDEDPEWTQINSNMLGEHIIKNIHLQDSIISKDNIMNLSIGSQHITDGSIQRSHIVNNAIDSSKLWKSSHANRVIASLVNDGDPVYTKINQEMLLDNIIGSNQLQNRSVLLSKLETSAHGMKVLAVVTPNTNPSWVQITSKMILEKTINGSNLFSSPIPDRVLAVTTAESDPAWLQINERMIKNNSIGSQHIIENAVNGMHISDFAIESNHIANGIIRSHHISPGAITGTELMRSPYPNRVMATTDPYSKAEWMQVKTDMIEDQAINGDKIFHSDHAYRVLGATNPFASPEYLMITSDFIVDDSIIPRKLVRDFIFWGTPEIEIRPELDADNRQIPDTSWVRRTVSNMVQDFNLTWQAVTRDMIEDHSIDGTKLFTHPHAPRVLGITHPNEDVEFLLIEEDLIVDGAVTQNKIARDITLMGTPKIEIRPAPAAYTTEIPDCKWVIDLLADEGWSTGGTGSGTGGTILDEGEFSDHCPDCLDPVTRAEIDAMFTTKYTGVIDDGDFSPECAQYLLATLNDEIDAIFNSIYTGDIDDGYWDGPCGESCLIEVSDSEIDSLFAGNNSFANGSITTNYLADRSVTAPKLFTSAISNRLLGVFSSNSNPVYLQAINEMISNRAIDGRTLFTSDVSNRILGVTEAGTDPSWMQINHDMMGSLSVGLDQMRDDSISVRNIINGSITQLKLTNAPIIDSTRLVDHSVTVSKIADQAVGTSKIADGSITSDKLSKDIKLPGNPVVESNTSYENRSLRNTILSPRLPTGCNNGDIWFQYN